MTKINEKLYIELYNTGKSSMELADLFNISERQAQRIEQRLRMKKKIKPRAALEIKNKLGLHSKNKIDIDTIISSTKKQWIIPSSAKSKNINKNFKVYLYLADNHVPEYNIPANKAILKLMNDIKLDGFGIVGDFMDMSPISHWNEHKHKTLETQRLQEHYILGNILLDEYDKRLPKNCDKSFFFGNHENWYFQLIEKMPVLEGLIHPTKELNLIKRGYKVYEDENHIEKVGRLLITHGVYATMYAVKKHIQEFKSNVLFFHTHRIGLRTEKSPAKEIAIVGYNGGCMCDKNPNYLRNKPNAWSHGFILVYYMPNGYFFVDNIRIIQGRFVYNGKLYDGNN